jgi:hypothetical protein
LDVFDFVVFGMSVDEADINFLGVEGRYGVGLFFLFAVLIIIPFGV